MLGPPLLMVPLAWFPWDMMTSLFWFAGGIAAFIAAKSVIKLLPIALRRHDCDLPRLVRAAATLVLFVAALAARSHSVTLADDLARATAIEVQAECRAAKACPAAPKSWQSGSANAVTYRRVGFTSEYDMRYSVTSGGESFTLVVVHDIDHALVIEGGVAGDVTEREVGDGVE